MEKSKKTLWITLILIFIGMFLLASVAAYEEDTLIRTTPAGSSYTIVQTYKTYETHQSTYTTIDSRRISYVNNLNDERQHCSYDRYDRNHYSCDNNYYHSYNRNNVNTIHYSQYATQTSRKSFLGDYVKEYSAYVTNRGRTGRYFTVKFTFEDKNGYEFSQSVTQYLKTGEKKKFVYKDLQYERNEILDWEYEIIPQRY